MDKQIKVCMNEVKYQNRTKGTSMGTDTPMSDPYPYPIPMRVHPYPCSTLIQMERLQYTFVACSFVSFTGQLH